MDYLAYRRGHRQTQSRICTPHPRAHHRGRGRV